jgi:putative ABC transport system permease protein
MTLLLYFLRTAMQNLRRGGQRALVALLCITFGVMSVVSMTLLSAAIERMLVVAPQQLIGADLTMDRVVENSILPEHIAALDGLAQSRQIQRYTLIAYTSSLTFHRPGSGELHFAAAGMGIDPANYPLAGAFQVSQPGNTGAATLIQRAGDLLVTRDIAREENLQLGDRLILADLAVGATVEGQIQGIVSDTPNHQGGKIYYSLETARILSSSHTPENTALVTAPNPTALIPTLEASGWRAFSAADMARSNTQVEGMFELALKGTGILGMLVGGIGIANTMLVLLRRRQREVAVLKTLGYRKGQLQLMFAIEAALLGISGSLVGAGLGVALSYGLVELFSRITNLLISWVFTPLPLLIGILVGIVTTISFAMFAIVLTSQVRPLALLRGEALEAGRIPWLQSAGLALLCGLPFLGVTALVMGSLLKGLGILLFALAGLAVLGGVLGAVAWLITRLLPLRHWPLLHMARSSLRRRGMALVFAMVALFVGTMSLALGIVVTTSAQRALDERLIKFDGDNISIIAPASEEAAIRAAIQAQLQVEHSTRGYQTPVETIQVVGDPSLSLAPLLIARERPDNYQLSGAAWGSDPNGVYTSGMQGVQRGSQVEVKLTDGSIQVLPVVGSYDIDFQGASPQPALGVLIPLQLSQRLAQPETVQFSVRAPNGLVKALSQQLGDALPQATVINLPAYAARFTQSYANLFVFAVAMAGLALLAGILLVANSVSLAMLDRRYEIGVLKAMGYTRRQVLLMLVIEYSLVALIASGFGLLVVKILLLLLGMANHLAGSLLVIAPGAALFILVASIGLTLLTVIGVTWQPTQVSPVVILNDRA